MKAIMLRMGIDSQYGGWNAPMDPETGEFVYVPIPESGAFKSGHETTYNQILPKLRDFAERHNKDLYKDLGFPWGLLSQYAHLDPDFNFFTYGDVERSRGKFLWDLAEDDVIVFYQGFRPIRRGPDRLCYALTGMFVVDEILRASEIPERRCYENAHTRALNPCSGHIVIRGKGTGSGRFDRCLPIGEYRNRAYRVKREILDLWGGLTVKDGFIQKCFYPPHFLDPDMFFDWLKAENVSLLRSNN